MWLVPINYNQIIYFVQYTLLFTQDIIRKIENIEECMYYHFFTNLQINDRRNKAIF